MRSKIFIAAILFASLAQAKKPKHYRTGTLLQMDSAECGVDENSGKSVCRFPLMRRLLHFYAMFSVNV